MLKSVVLKREAYHAGQQARLKALIDLSAIVNSSLDITEIRKKAIEAAMSLFGAEAGSLLFVDKETGGLYFDVALGDKGDRAKAVRLEKGQGIAGWVALHGDPVIANDARSDSRFFHGADSESGFVTKNMICVPVSSRGRTLGVLQAMNKIGGFDNSDLDLFIALSNQVAVAMENARLYNELKETFYAVVNAMAETIEKRDPYTAGHTSRVSVYSMSIGRAMGLQGGEMGNLRLSAILHDIGKIGVRDAVLLKNQRLTPEEETLIRKHVEYGADILGHIPQLREVIPGVRSHHEKYNGTGYPDGTAGEVIPLPARIIAVADTFDAMTTDRPYRKGLSAGQAIAELKRCSGTQFDPSVVAAFVKAWEDGRLGIPE
ncbi:MAG: GAF domain-containing protein [Nitrospiraceae bacterium]|nr:GAF domain-containing protein [Nitrospiraceae bacterium]